jgi:hypothetical protein
VRGGRRCAASQTTDSGPGVDPLLIEDSVEVGHGAPAGPRLVDRAGALTSSRTLGDHQGTDSLDVAVPAPWVLAVHGLTERLWLC